MHHPRLDLSSVQWHKSSHSGSDLITECIETALGIPGFVPVRDSKNPDGPALVFQVPAWDTFVTAVKHDTLGQA
ncbi:DUF397 domain-containing protein [Streptomyces sp. B1866]|uniref:DUF397 domain-containing protein n=1 Tax=Streptomyces sp. B1866 TaxID=3075431 RepID=UPI00288FF8F2|nr:DUF397 domain-containing protein [Streptomyces sp. B1866]MDT3397149.1 DUF397 domain-containing protein [Streptomyces sp. B1866]